MKVLRGLFLLLAIATLLVLLLIVFNLAEFGSFRLERFREPTLAFYSFIIIFIALRKNFRSYSRDLIQTVRGQLEHKYFFPIMAGTMLGLYVISCVTRHLALETCSHDFSMIDEAIYNSHNGHFLYSPVLGMSFLGEHFSPILVILIPLHFVLTTPYLLIVTHALVLWSAVLMLRKVLAKNGASILAQNVACLIYLNHPVSIRTLNYVFHMECFLPAILLGVFWYYQNGPAWKYWILLMIALMIKEDVGIYLVGFAAYIVLYDKKLTVGLITAAVSCLWVFLSLQVLIPQFAGHPGTYKFLSRWNQFGTNPQEILLGFFLHPVLLLKSMFAKNYILFFASILFLPFFSKGGWLLLMIPWIITSTSSAKLQSDMALYYGVPLFSFSILGSIQAFSTPLFERLKRSRAMAYLIFAVVAMNVAHLSYPSIPDTRKDFLAQVNVIPQDATIQTLPCLYPALGYERKKTLLLTGTPLSARFLLFRTHTATWPFTRQQIDQALQNALSSGRYGIDWSGSEFYILKRTKSEPGKKAPALVMPGES